MAEDTFLPQNAALVDQRGFITRPWWPVFERLRQLIAAIIPIDLATETTGVLPAAKIGPHRTSHEPGGSDALQLTGASRLFGRGNSGAGALQEIALGTNLSMAGTTLNATGGGGGGDVTGPASATADALAIYNGTTGKIIKDSLLGITNVARRDQDNTFLGVQRIDPATGNPNPQLRFWEPFAVANKRLWAFQGSNQELQLLSVNDAGSLIESTFRWDRAGNMRATGNYYESTRTTPMGHWIDVPFNAANFGIDAGTWNLAGLVYVNRYTVIGKTMIWALTTGIGTLSQSSANLILVIPGGYTSAFIYASAPVAMVQTGGVDYTGRIYAAGTNGSTLVVQRVPSGSYTTSAGIQFTISFEVS